MPFIRVLRTGLVALSLLAMGSCDGNEPGLDATVDADSPSAPRMMAFTHKMFRSTGENEFAALGYECSQCTFEQWLAIVPPEGWTKGPAQVLVADSGEIRSNPSFEGVPDTVDFIDEVPGSEYQLIVKNLDARVITAGAGGVVVEAQVMRDTLLRFDAGRRVHEITNPEGNVFVLFAYGVDPEDVVIPDFDDPGLFDGLTPPDGWTYSSRVIEEELLLDTTDTTTVLAIRGEFLSTWEMR